MSSTDTPPPVSPLEPSEEQTPEQRLEFLRLHGVEVETVEERALKKDSEKNNNPYNNCTKQLSTSVNPSDFAGVDFVHIPWDSSKPIRTLKLPLLYVQSLPSTTGDLLVNFVKPAFADGLGVDQTLLNETSQKQFATGDMKQMANKNVTASSMNSVSEQGSVETFPLVHPAPTNNHTGVYIYLDEVGMLKKLPLNPRAQSLTSQCGYAPPPKFYGDVFVGRCVTKPVMNNVDFSSESGDCEGGASWMVKAVSENLAWQASMNNVTGRKDLQPSNKGEDGSVEKGEGFTWRQENDEVEVVVTLPDKGLSSKKYVKVTFLQQEFRVKYDGVEVLTLKLYNKIDTDGCFWTMEKGDLVVTLEKAEAQSWPRVEA